MMLVLICFIKRDNFIKVHIIFEFTLYRLDLTS
jgi:hypothetical protein